MANSKNIPWTNGEVQTFLCVVADEKIQRELDGATRNERIYQEVAKRLAQHGYHRTARQCREKLKKMKCDYRATKCQGGQRGAFRKNWRWFEQMDAIYGHKYSSINKECGLDLATTELESLMREVPDSQHEESFTGCSLPCKQTPLDSQMSSRVVQVTGNAELSCPPDLATVLINVSSSKEALNDVKNSVLRRVEYILQTVRQHDVKENETIVTEHLQRTDDLYIMEAEVQVVFTNFDKMQRVRSVLLEKLDKSVFVGVPQFTHSSECLAELRRRVCVAAAENARLKASEMCCTLGQALGRPLQVREEEAHEWSGGVVAAAGAPGGGGPAGGAVGLPDGPDARMPLQQRTGLIHHNVSSRVFVAFELEPKDGFRKRL